MASNSPVLLEDGDGQIVAELSDSLMSAPEAQATKHQASKNQMPVIPDEVKYEPQAHRETGDQVNRFLLCRLVSESARQIKMNAEKVGESLPMTMIIRGVLQCYRAAARDETGPLAGPDPDIVGLRNLNKAVLKDQIARHSRDRVTIKQGQLERAKRLGDGTRIKDQKEELELAIELRNRLAEKFR